MVYLIGAQLGRSSQHQSVTVSWSYSLRVDTDASLLLLNLTASMQSMQAAHICPDTTDICFLSSEVELSKLEELLMETHRLSPKAKVVKNATVRRKKRPLPHMRSQHLDEALSPVTTPTDDEVIQRIKHVVGSTQTRHQSPEHHHLAGGFALYSVSKLLFIISFVYAPNTHKKTHSVKQKSST